LTDRRRGAVRAELHLNVGRVLDHFVELGAVHAGVDDLQVVAGRVRHGAVPAELLDQFLLLRIVRVQHQILLVAELLYQVDERRPLAGLRLQHAAQHLIGQQRDELLAVALRLVRRARVLLREVVRVLGRNGHVELRHVDRADDREQPLQRRHVDRDGAIDRAAAAEAVELLRGARRRRKVRRPVGDGHVPARVLEQVLLPRRRRIDVVARTRHPVFAVLHGVVELHVFDAALVEPHGAEHGHEPARRQQLRVVLRQDEVGTRAVKAEEVRRERAGAVVGVEEVAQPARGASAAAPMPVFGRLTCDATAPVPLTRRGRSCSHTSSPRP
jgi:hypothetical protein